MIKRLHLDGNFEVQREVQPPALTSSPVPKAVTGRVTWAVSNPETIKEMEELLTARMGIPHGFLSEAIHASGGMKGSLGIK